LSCFRLGNTQILNVDNTFSWKSLNGYLYQFSSEDKSLKDIHRITLIRNDKWKKVPESGFKKPYDRRFWWLKMDVSVQQEGYYTLENEYTMLEDFALYVIENDSIVHFYGDQGIRNPTYPKSFNHKYPMFRLFLEENKKYTIYLYLNKTFSTSALPIKLFSPQVFFEKNAKDERQYGVIYGIIFVLVFMGVITGIIFKSRIYYYYTFYMIGLAGILFVSNGLFRVLLPQHLHMEGYFFMYYAVLMTFFGLYLMLYKLLKIKSEFPHLHRIIQLKVLISLISILINNFAFFYWENYPLILYKISNLFVILYPIFMIGICVFSYRKTKEDKALFFLFVFIFTLVFTVLFSLLPFSLVSHNQFMFFRWLIVFEGITVLLILHRDLYLSKIKTIILQKDLLDTQQKSVELYLQGLSDERTRLSQRLHDSISARLAALGMKINFDSSRNYSNVSYYIEELRKIQEEVRTTSHDLSPFKLSKKPLNISIEDEIVKLEEIYDEVIFEFQVKNVSKFENLSGNQKELFFWTFKELVQNALKHAQTDKISVSLRFENNQYVLDVRDFGIGYEFENIVFTGIGLETIQQRAILSSGKFDILKGNPGMIHVFSIKEN
jgi:signal transduction histidine kinase